MSVFRINAIALIVSTSMLSCFVKRNENYCEGRNPNNNCSEPDTRPDAAPPSCPDETECSAPTGVCNTGTGQCVQCTAGATGNQAACTATRPCAAQTTPAKRAPLIFSAKPQTSVCRPGLAQRRTILTSRMWVLEGQARRAQKPSRARSNRLSTKGGATTSR